MARLMSLGRHPAFSECERPQSNNAVIGPVSPQGLGRNCDVRADRLHAQEGGREGEKTEREDTMAKLRNHPALAKGMVDAQSCRSPYVDLNYTGYFDILIP